MRVSAVIDSARGLGEHDHAGGVFDRPAEFREHAGRFLADGLSSGQRIVYVAGADTDGPTGVDGLDAALATGQAQITSVSALYGAGEPVDPERQVAAFAEAADRAVADGWTGLRVAADVTSLVVTEPQRAVWVRYEFLIDGCMAQRPLTRLCGFHREAIDDAVLAGVTCVHPALIGRSSHFRLYAVARPDTSIAVAGEIDPDNLEVFATALRRAEPSPVGDTLVVDAGALAFIDHHGMAELARYAADRAVTAVVHAKAGSTVGTIAQVASMPGLEVVMS